MKKHFKQLLAVGVIVAVVLGGLVYWNVLRVDPEYAAQQADIEETIKSLDSDLGADDDDDFDLDKELESLGMDEQVGDDEIDLD